MAKAAKVTKSSGRSTGRPKPMTAKAGFTKSSNRRYGCGGKLRK